MRGCLAAFGIVVALCVSVPNWAQQTPEPILKSAGQPQYPALPRVAHIEGEVRLEFVLNQNGEPSSVTVISGHKMLVPAAVETVKSWRFEFPENAFQEGRKYETTFVYKLAKKAIEQENQPKLSVSMDTFHRVEITATWAEAQASKCPAPDTQPPASTGTQDFVEVFRSACYGSCPVYTVRVSANGDVLWNGRMFVNARGERRATMKAEEARALVERFRTPQFWSLCDSYTRSITDSSTIETHVEIAGQSKTVSNYADSAPAWVADLENAVDDAANTHRWRHGDPKTEPLTHIFNDAYMPKPRSHAANACSGARQRGQHARAVEARSQSLGYRRKRLDAAHVRSSEFIFRACAVVASNGSRSQPEIYNWRHSADGVGN